MNYFPYLISIALVAASCQSKKADQPEETSKLSASDSLVAKGYTSLFDGTTLNGWRTFKNKPNNSWEVSAGVLHCKPWIEEGTNERSDLITTEQYENFELVFDWKIPYQANSGVMFRVSEDYDEPYATGPEYQVIDDEDFPGDLKDVQLTAGNYDMHVAENKKMNPSGQWNNSKIVVNGNHVEHWLNGQKTVDYDLYSEDWTKRKNASKWKDFPGYATIKKGHIALQDHSSEVWYRNIGIRVLN